MTKDLQSLKTYIADCVANAEVTTFKRYTSIGEICTLTRNAAVTTKPYVLKETTKNTGVASRNLELAKLWLSNIYDDVGAVFVQACIRVGLIGNMLTLSFIENGKCVIMLQIPTAQIVHLLAPEIVYVNLDNVNDNDTLKYAMYRKMHLTSTLAINSTNAVGKGQQTLERILSAPVSLSTNIDHTQIPQVKRDCIDLWYGVEELLQHDYNPKSK